MGSRSVCKVCHQQWSQYTCPRCNLQYCSLDCYKRHGQCSETFYRENATEHLRDIQASQEDRQRMLTILKRVQQQDGAELASEQHNDSGSETESQDDVGISESLLQKLSLEDADGDFDLNEADLTPAELQSFRRAVASGRLNNLLPLWTPWWTLPEAATVKLSASGTSIVSVQGSDTGQIDGVTAASLPAAPRQPLPLLKTLTKAAPSPLLQYQLLDILYTYCFVMRLYNGDYHSDPQEAVMTLLQVSKVLGATATSAKTQSSLSKFNVHTDSNQAQSIAFLPTSAAEALSGCAEGVCSPSIMGPAGRSTAVGFFKDAATVTQHGRPVVILALQDLHDLFTLSQEQVKLQSKQAVSDQSSTCQQKPHKHWQKHSVSVRGNKAILRKLHFFLAWANELSDTTFAEVSQATLHEWQQHASTVAESDSSNQLDIDPFIQATLTNKIDANKRVMIQEN